MIFGKDGDKVMTFENKSSNITVLDSIVNSGELKGEIYFWNDYKEDISQCHFSVPKYIDTHSSVLKEEYLKFIYDLGKSRIGNKSLVEIFEIRPSFSYWWMTSIVEKCNHDLSVYITSIVKLFAFRRMINNKKISSVTLLSNDPALIEVIRKYTISRNISFRIISKKENFKRRIILGYFPTVLIAYGSILKYFVKNFYIRIARKKSFVKKDPGIMFVNYFFQITQESAFSGIFSSGYWGRLIDFLRKEQITTNWIHIFVNNPVASSLSSAKKIIQKYSEKSLNENHQFLEENLNFSLLFKIFKDLIIVQVRSSLIKRFIGKTMIHISGFDVWPLFKKDWENTFSGSGLASNCIFLHLIERQLKKIPKQRLGFYLQENQGWEMALIHFWKSNGHGTIIGVPHSTVRYWDLRYFNLPDLYNENIQNKMPMPDFVALNGKEAYLQYINAGYPKDRIVKVEALRYLYLKHKFSKFSKRKNRILKILVLTDFDSEISRTQLKMMEDAMEKIKININLTVKSHPASSIDKVNFPFLNFNLADKPLIKLLEEADLAFTSNITSSALDAYCMDVPVISILDGESLNMSPLRGGKNVLFVSDSNELSSVINNFKFISKTKISPDKYFYLDPELTNWKKLIEASCKN